MSLPLQLVWNNLIEGSVKVVVQPVGDTVSSPAKQSKGAAKAKATAAASVLPVNSDPMPRSRGFMFCYKDMVYVIGGDDAGTLECLSAPAVSGARPASPVKKSGSKKGQEAAAASAATPTGANAASSSFLVHPCSGKAPPPRKYFAACCNYGSSSAADAATATSGGGGLSHHPRHGGTHATVPQQNAPHSVLVTCGWSLTAGAALDDVWELKLPQFSWSQVTVKPPTLPKRYDHAAVHVGGKLYVFGGVDPKTEQLLGDFWVLDDQGGADGGGRRWIPAIGQGDCSGGAHGLDDDAVFRLKRPCARQQHSMAAGPRGMVLLYGGVAANGEVLNDLWYLHATHTVNLVTVDTFGRMETFPTPLLVWRQIVVPDSVIPRRCGAALVICNVPEGVDGHRTRRRSAKSTEGDGECDASFLLLVCGGWDSTYNNPFRATVGVEREAPPNGDMRRKSSAQLYRSDTVVMSFRKSDLVEVPHAGDGEAGASGYSATAGVMGASDRRRSSTAVRFRSVIRNRLKSLVDSPPIPAPPSVIAFLAHIGPAVDDCAEHGRNFLAATVNLDVPMVAERDSASCGSATPEPRAISLSRSVAVGKGHSIALPRPPISNVSAKMRAMFSSAISRCLDAPPRSIRDDLQLSIEVVDCREIGTDAPSVHARSAMGESALPASPTKSARATRAGDNKLSVTGGGGATSANQAAPIASEVYSRRNIPVAAEGSMWCRGFGSRNHVLCFGGEMTPLVLRSDLWRGEIAELAVREPFETAFFSL